MSDEKEIKATKNGAGMALGMGMMMKQAQAYYATPRPERGDFHNTINAQDDNFTKEEIQKYYDKIMACEELIKIELDWVKEIWQKINTADLIPSEVYLNSHSGDIHTDALIPDQYTIIVHLTPDMEPEDGGTIEFWTPNITDEVRAIATETPFGLEQQQEHKKDIVKSYWPKPGRVTIFDARIPHVIRELTTTSKKTRVSLVFKCTNL